MFGRLLKHQLKSTWKEFTILFGVIIALGIALGLAFKFESILLLLGVIILAYGVIIAVSVLYTIFVYKITFSQTYGKQAYLMFSIPISQNALILSKIITQLIYGVSMILSMFIAVLLALLFISPEVMTELLKVLPNAIGALYSIKNAPILVLLYIFYLICAEAFALISLQFIAALANTGITRKHRIILAIALYIGLQTIYQILVYTLDPIQCFVGMTFANTIGFTCLWQYSSVDRLIQSIAVRNLGNVSIWELVILIAGSIGMYIGTIKILQHKIEIE